MSYIGSTPTTQSFIAGTDYFNGDGTTVNFTMSRAVNSVNDIEVIVNNVEQIPSGYSVSGTTLTFSAAPSAGTSNVYVRYLSTTNLSLAIPSGTSATFNTITATTVNTTALTVTNGASIQGLTVGRGAGAVATNTAVGASALAANTSGSNNVAVGYRALSSMTTGNTCVAVGQDALKVSVAGTENTAVGFQSMLSTLTASKNSALGLNSLSNNTTGSNNTAIGHSALTANTTANNNTAVGYQAGKATTTGAQNTFIGTNAGNVVTGSYNTMVGYAAGNVATTGTNNTFIGAGSAGSAGEAITTGAKNVILGGYTGNNGGLDIRTASNRIVLSDGDGNPRAVWNQNGYLSTGGISNYGSFDNGVVYGANAVGWTVDLTASTGALAGSYVRFANQSPNNTASRFIVCFDSTADRMFVYSNGGIVNYQANNANLSDRREKTNFAPATSYLDKICAIPVQTFNYIDQNLEEDGGLTLGVVAQDVQAVAPELVTESNWATEEAPKMRLSIYQTDLQYALMKCIQEQQALITALTNRITALENNNATQ